MLLDRVLILAFVALASAKSRGKRACKPAQQPLGGSSSNGTGSEAASSVIIPVASSVVPVGGSDGGPTLVPSATEGGQTSPAGTAAALGATISASFTEYGAGDSFGSGNCNVDTTACGFHDSPGYNAAASENLFGVGPGAGAGPACHKCYHLVLETDSSGKPASGQVTVKINNLCPAQGNVLCAQQGLSGTNQFGANVNFDLCIDGGAAGAFFPAGMGLGLGHAYEVACGS